MHKIILILGAPCSGKGTQCLLLDSISHLSAGDLLRKKYPLGTESRTLLDNGNLVSVELINNIIGEEIAQSTGDMIIDGYPRTVDQANFITSFPISCAFVLEARKETVFNRMIKREICNICGKSYSESTACCSVKTVKRLDDNPQSFEKRFAVFQKDISQILDTLSCKIHFINSEQSIAEVHEQIIKLL
jgi:adenylate kinase